jgi:L-amino acid N-acyltransferase YncA
MASNVLIRPVEIEDAQAIAKIHVDAWLDTYQSIISNRVLDELSYETRETFWQEQIAGLVAPSFILVAEAKGSGIVGFISGGLNRDESAEFDAEVYAIYLNETYQGCGIGRKLFGSAAAFLEVSGLQSLIVWVLAENPSRFFYERLQGVDVAARKIEMGDQQHVEVAYGWKGLEQLREYVE